MLLVNYSLTNQFNPSSLFRPSRSSVNDRHRMQHAGKEIKTSTHAVGSQLGEDRGHIPKKKSFLKDVMLELYCEEELAGAQGKGGRRAKEQNMRRHTRTSTEEWEGVLDGIARLSEPGTDWKGGGTQKPAGQEVLQGLGRWGGGGGRPRMGKNVERVAYLKMGLRRD